MSISKRLECDTTILARSFDRRSVQLLENEKNQTGEALWKHYARAMLPLSPVAKKSQEHEALSNCARGESEENRETYMYSEKPTFDSQDDRNTDLVVESEPYTCLPSEKNSPKRHNRNTMLKRLADCFAHRHTRVKSGARRHRVMGFYPKLYTIHENASELAKDFEENYQMAVNSNTEDMDLLENELHNFDHTDASFIPCCNTNDQKIVALREDIKELWKRLENVERELAWARGNLLTRHSDVN